MLLMACTLLAPSCTRGASAGLPVTGGAAGGVQPLPDLAVQAEVDGAEQLLELGDGAGTDDRDRPAAGPA